MIVPMMRYSFLLCDSDAVPFLRHLQELGVVDIEKESCEPSQKLQDIFLKVQRISQATAFISVFSGEQAGENTKDLKSADPYAVMDELDGLRTEKERVEQEIQRLEKEKKDAEPWGELGEDFYKRMQSMGLSVLFYSCSISAFSKISESDENSYIYEVSRSDKAVFFIAIIPENGNNTGINANEYKAPSMSASGLSMELAWKKKRLGEINSRFAEISKYMGILSKEKDVLMDKADFHSVMEEGVSQEKEKLSVLTGYVPNDQHTALDNFLEQHPVVYLSEKVNKGEYAPILLKNGKIARLFEPIGKLYSLPAYMELDLTALFAPFFMLFFSFCLGDGGYGLILWLGATIGIRKAPHLKSAFRLVQILGISTVVFCLFTGAFFGVKLGDFALFDNVKAYFLTDDNLFYIAMGIGVVQILFGMLVKVSNLIRQGGFLSAISTLSWLIFFVSMILFYVASLNESWGVAMFNIPHLIITGICLIGIFLFNTPGKNVFLNIGTGVWDSYNMATGLMGDILSYIRLFALNLSGGILAGVFNSLAFGMSPDIPVLGWIITLIILLFGHGINIFMCTLGSLVHPMRLTFVEFYKNAGFIGGGKEYSPFSKRVCSESSMAK